MPKVTEKINGAASVDIIEQLLLRLLFRING
jgi:hypothetical protein